MDIDWKKLLGTVAPAIATALGGPLAGVAMQGITSSLRMQPGASQDEVAAKVAAATPEDLLKLKQADQQFLKDMKALDVDVFKTEAADRDSARKAAVAGGTAKDLFWLSIFLLAVSLGAELAVLFRGYPDNVPEIIVGRVLGLLDAVAMMVLSFWYGTTKGSQQKDATIQSLAKS